MYTYELDLIKHRVTIVTRITIFLHSKTRTNSPNECFERKGATVDVDVKQTHEYNQRGQLRCVSKNGLACRMTSCTC